MCGRVHYGWVDFMDFIVLGIGVIILMLSITISYLSGVRAGKFEIREDYKDHISLKGLSKPAREKLSRHYQTTLIWDEERGPNRNLFKPVHFD